MKKFNLIVSLAVLLFTAVQANAQMSDNKDHVWKRHNGYMTFGYENQSVGANGISLPCEYGFVFDAGHTYYLHKKPLAGLIKFGLDWKVLDLSYADFGPLFDEADMEGADGEIPDLSVMKVDVGMGLGPMVTVNPIDYLQAGAYFHVTPSYSLFLDNSGLYGGYATYFNAGLRLSYKAISVGFEYRWCDDAKYKPFGGEDDSMEYDLEDSADAYETALSTTSTRVYIALRFGGKRYKK